MSIAQGTPVTEAPDWENPALNKRIKANPKIICFIPYEFTAQTYIDPSREIMK
jgi:hypothetical protein